ncbi:MAG: selenocysteine-specific translation elongation factor [Deltaproteobacteria bacterium]|uniref:Selenocysteine-specific elongation factor n=1 Tax=Candidatus Zymogenus saltonus TaxID=2844893 RepID=A0A9D8KDG7_9DELT|nr:selenocysteine-specific translation elongation factor [Candidatus Zymogenus saltonus]
MKRLILGTAGHIDHGKTALIKALTGIDTDRLKEEKERGITIELGFAYLDLPSGTRLGIVDVPGHEKFVKNMVAGSGGIDIVALVVAADEGIMPQTVEHMNILKLLDVPLGVVIITKVDTVDEEMISLVEEELFDFTSGTFLEGAPVVRVSSITGDGIDELISVLDGLLSKVEGRGASGLFRLPVDRVFTMKGFGTVITGTLLSGGVKAGEEITIMPTGKAARIRGIQVHNDSVDEAVAGTRTAINLTGIDRESIKRGDTIISPGTIEPTYMIDAKLSYLSDNAKNLKNRERVRFHLGTSEVIVNVVLMEREEVAPGDEAYVQIRLTEPVVAVPGDRFVIRSLSPVTTVGGGEILNAHPKKHKRFKEDTIEDFEILTRGELDERAVVFLRDTGYIGATAKELEVRMGTSQTKTNKILDKLLGDRRIVVFDKDKGGYLEGETYGRLKGVAIERIGEYHAKNPKEEGISKEELFRKMPWGVGQKLFAKLMDDLAGKDKISAAGERIALSSHKVVLKADEEEIIKGAVDMIRGGGLSPPSTQEMAEALKVTEAEVKKLLTVNARDGKIVRVKENLYFDAGDLDDLKKKLIEYLKEKGEITTQGFKDMTGSTRKYMIPLFEYFDSEKVTIRIGDVRKLRERGGG